MITNMKKILMVVICFSLICATLATAGCGGSDKATGESKEEVSKPQESNLKTKKDVMINSNTQNDEASLLWKWDIGISGSIISKITISDNKAFFGTSSNTLYCCNIEPTFEIIWQYRTHIEMNSPPLIINGKIYFKSDDDRLCCLDENTGTKLWDFETEGNLLTLPEISNNKAIFGSLVAQHGVLICLDAENGEKYWEYETSEMFTNITAVNNKVYFGASNYRDRKGEFYCLNQDNGEKKWGLKIDGIIQEKPVISNNNVFFSFNDKNSRTLLYCLNGDNGNKLWELKDVSSESVTILNQKLYSGINCLNADNGDRIWECKSNIRNDCYLSSPLIASQDRIFFRSGNPSSSDSEQEFGIVNCLEEKTGKKLWEFKKTYDYFTAISNIDGKIIVQSKDSNIYCINELDGKEVWEYQVGNDIIHTQAISSSILIVFSTQQVNEPSSIIEYINLDNGGKVFEFSTNNRISTSPVIHNDRVYFGSKLLKNDKLYCLNSENGDKIWEKNFSGRFGTNLIINTDMIFFGENENYKGKMNCINANNGEIIWEFKKEAEVLASPVVYNGKIFFPISSWYYCLNAGSGELIWSFETMCSLTMPVAIADGKVFLGSSMDGIYCLNAETGEKIWKHETNNKLSQPTYSNGKVYFGSEFYDYSLLYCVKADTGEKIWEFKSKGSIEKAPSATNDYVCFLSNGTFENHVGKLFCLKASDGEKNWEFPIGYTSSSPPEIIDDRVYFGFGKMLICFDAQNGKNIFRNIIKGAIEFSPVFSNGKIYVGSNDGRLYCFSDQE